VSVDWTGPESYWLQAAAGSLPRLIDLLMAAGVARASPEAVETARIEAGLPGPADIPAKTLPQELGRDARAISFTKGCYLGQETVARIDALGHVNRRLTAVATDAAAARVGAEVRRAGVVVGRVTSSCVSPLAASGLALALVQCRDAVPEGPLDVEGTPARVIDLPLPVTPPAEAGDGELLVETRRFRVVRVSEPGADGAGRSREVVVHPGSVVILPFVSPSEVCLVEVVRVAVGRTLLELPAGTLDRVESLEEAARRELAEETGYRAGRMTAAAEFWMSPGILRERMHLFVADDLVAGSQALEPGEQIRTRVVAWDEAVSMCLDGRIEDAKTVASILLVDARRRAAAGPAGGR
jgi:ADP-ribose pyrophosphatase